MGKYLFFIKKIRINADFQVFKVLLLLFLFYNEHGKKRFYAVKIYTLEVEMKMLCRKLFYGCSMRCLEVVSI